MAPITFNGPPTFARVCARARFKHNDLWRAPTCVQLAAHELRKHASDPHLVRLALSPAERVLLGLQPRRGLGGGLGGAPRHFWEIMRKAGALRGEAAGSA